MFHAGQDGTRTRLDAVGSRDDGVRGRERGEVERESEGGGGEPEVLIGLDVVNGKTLSQ